MAVLPVGIHVERLLDEDQVIFAETETVKESRAVLVAARDRGDDLQRPSFMMSTHVPEPGTHQGSQHSAARL